MQALTTSSPFLYFVNEMAVSSGHDNVKLNDRHSANANTEANLRTLPWTTKEFPH